MFHEWLKACPVVICTWSRLIKALTKLDPKTAQSVSDTIFTDLKEMQQQTHQFTTDVSPITVGGKNRLKVLECESHHHLCH